MELPPNRLTGLEPCECAAQQKDHYDGHSYERYAETYQRAAPAICDYGVIRQAGLHEIHFRVVAKNRENAEINPSQKRAVRLCDLRCNGSGIGYDVEAHDHVKCQRTNCYSNNYGRKCHAR